MTYSAPDPSYMPPILLSTLSMESAGRIPVTRLTAPVSAVWSATNRIVYVPFYLNRTVTVYKLWWLNGATVGTNNLQAGVYDENLARVIAGTSTLSAGTANLCQFDDITDTVIGPGRFYMALWCNGTTATVFRNTAGGVGVYVQTAAGGLPATATPAAIGGGGGAPIPVFGLSLRSSP